MTRPPIANGRLSRLRCAGLDANLDAPRRGSPPEADGTAFEDEEQDGLEDLAAGAAALRFGRDLRLLEVRQMPDHRRCSHRTMVVAASLEATTDGRRCSFKS